MTHTEEKIENLSQVVGLDLSNQFEKKVSKTMKELIDSLEHPMKESRINAITNVLNNLIIIFVILLLI